MTDSRRGSTVLRVNDTRVVLRPRDNEPKLGHEVWDLIDAAEQFRHGLGRD